MQRPQLDWGPGQSLLLVQLYAGFWLMQVRDSVKEVPMAAAAGRREVCSGNVDTLVIRLVTGLNAELV
jgi:hypothetical protein